MSFLLVKVMRRNPTVTGPRAFAREGTLVLHLARIQFLNSRAEIIAPPTAPMTRPMNAPPKAH